MATKASRDIATAFVNRTRATAHNRTTNGQEVLLHGNRIAFRANGNVYVTLAGWNTPTTRRYLNQILAALNCGAQFYTRKYEPYAGATWRDTDGAVTSRWEIEVSDRDVFRVNEAAQLGQGDPLVIDEVTE